MMRVYSPSRNIVDFIVLLDWHVERAARDFEFIVRYSNMFCERSTRHYDSSSDENNLLYPCTVYFNKIDSWSALGCIDSSTIDVIDYVPVFRIELKRTV